MIFTSKINKAFFILFLCLALTAWIDPFKDEVEKGNSSYQAEDFDNAIEHYDNSEKYVPDSKKEGMLFFNKGAAEYKKGNYQKGIDLFNESLKSKDPEVQKKAYFNMGNGYVKLDKFDEAFNSYARALKIDPSYEKAKKNIEYMLKKDENQKNENSGNDDKQKSEKNNSKNENKQEDKQKGDDPPQAEEPEKMKSSNISKEQMKNMLESLKNKPVRRQKEKGGEYEEPEKAW